ncbi:hypothetical protein SP15_140 [Bacillus phage SP-15]|uniref:Uncharacterized protein n=1 Tax=Bacillus phage SP-15 TaxID=1792032 RepID=A0A127AWB2_9CAUD|nr:hypothetical protein SP15_140 [Bacillus phage SP-15]AMM44938.1 hypothetical protein SP15_140 [Bacillus phage SP-15]
MTNQSAVTPDDLLNQMSETNDLYFVSMMLLYLQKEDSRYSTLSELSFILDQSSFLNLIWFYEGQTIKIPTKKELSESLRLILCYYYYDVQKLPWEEVFHKIGLEYDVKTSRHLKAKMSWFRKNLKNIKLPKSLKPETEQ